MHMCTGAGGITRQATEGGLSKMTCGGWLGKESEMWGGGQIPNNNRKGMNKK